jgi:polyhydroxyalkanoate synthesis repressor PhaR
MSEGPIQITRYPNRRFYARNESKYISLQGIEELVRSGQDVEIHDSQTDEDLTRCVLTRIIMERQPEKMRLFPTAMLHFIVRSNEMTSDFLRDYFRHALPYLEYLHRHSAAAMSLAQPMHWVKAWLDSIPRLRETNSPKPAADDAAQLARRVAELEARLRQLESVGTEEVPSGP